MLVVRIRLYFGSIRSSYWMRGLSITAALTAANLRCKIYIWEQEIEVDRLQSTSRFEFVLFLCLFSFFDTIFV